ncbi:MAG TPA: ImmA/IrrE family metallo-endopeptidase [Candidatus Saccharimonadales bacterium]|nr:ImmA/IrrE family metallo-endopeptidase [Candidatus Saccharimonadales bacterium]
MSVDRNAIKAKAKAIREQYGVTERPVRLSEIARKEGIEILYFIPNEKTNEIFGLLDKKKKTIFLNADEPAARQSFTLAHELGHYFLHHKSNEYDVYRRDSLYAEGKPEKEQEADYFAAELLMPEELIQRFKSRYDLDDNNISSLSKLFGVSPGAMRYRLKDLSRGRNTQ